MDEIERFLKELIPGTDAAYRSYAETAYTYYKQHGHLSDGLIKSVQTNAARQKKTPPKGLSNRPDIDQQIADDPLPEGLLLKIDFDTDADLLDDLALVLKRFAKRNRARDK